MSANRAAEVRNGLLMVPMQAIELEHKSQAKLEKIIAGKPVPPPGGSTIP